MNDQTPQNQQNQQDQQNRQDQQTAGSAADPTAPVAARRFHLARRPEGWPEAEDVPLRTDDLPALADGEVRVRNTWLSVDPYMRGRMVDRESYVPPFAIDEPLQGGALGIVVASRSDDLPVGTPVQHVQGWRDLAQGSAREFSAYEPIEGVPESLRLHLLGMTGLTAYVALTEIARLREGDVVFVSGAAGAVGTAAGQMARLLGASRVIGSAGSREKTALLTEKYGYDAAIDYKAAPIREQLPEAAPDGIDVYIDNVGGDHLEAALDVMRRGGRAALIGAIAQYNDTAPTPGPDNLARLVTHSLMLRGFTVGDFAAQYRDEFAARAGQWVRDGELVWDETVRDGLESTFDAFVEMMRGANTGKMLVRLRGA
ncbi:NADP-dependent oxidoreductase [Brachybacterium huguangmaarense]